VKKLHVKWWPVAALSFSMLYGCGSGTTLDVRYPDQSTQPALLASAPPRRVAVLPVADRRIDGSRIGSWPKDDGAIVTSRPVAEIVHAALVAELTRNGHTIAVETPDLTLAAAVEAFSLESTRIYPGRQFLGRVVIVLTVTDGRSGSSVLSRRFIGIKRRLVDETSEQVAQEVMDAALARAMRDLATDPELAAVLARVSAVRSVPPRRDSPRT
jgi:hypothetical protein